MALYAIGDLHLAFAVDKPMDVFGTSWMNHPEQIEHNWRQHIRPDDTILIPGDISWAMTLTEAQADLDWIAKLPGQKVMIRGNHDYWWSGIGKVRARLPEQMYAIQNDSLPLNGYVIAGTRGWLLPNHPSFTEEDERILQRELNRLRLSLESASKYQAPIICMLHYPPAVNAQTPTVFTDLLEEYAVAICLYGHLHGTAHRFAFNGRRNGVQYQLVSSDYLQFVPWLVPTLS